MYWLPSLKLVSINYNENILDYYIKNLNYTFNTDALDAIIIFIIICWLIIHTTKIFTNSLLSDASLTL